MATQAAALRYASYGAGSGYYETSPRKVAVPDIPAERPASIPAARPAVRTAARTKHVYGISLFAIFGSAFAAVLFLFVILATINHVDVTDGTVKLEARLAELDKEGKRLAIAYEQAFDMNAVEDYAVNVLGMVKPDADQTMMVNATPHDRAVILAEPEEEGGGGFGSFLSSLLEYLK